MEKKSSVVKKQAKRISAGSIFIVLFILISIVVALFLISPTPHYTNGFVTIDEVKADAAERNELAPVENTNFRAPTWAKYHTRTNPTYFTRKISNMLSMLGLKKRPAWSPSYFKFLLEKLLEDRSKAGHGPQHVVRVVPSEKSRFVVWGDLGGAYHSLVRGMEKVISLNILDKNFKLISPDDYIVFMGDAVNRSPFIMETLTLIFTLMDRNPGKIIYIKGSDEWKGNWHPYGLQESFDHKAAHLASREYFTKTLDKFFDTLPYALYASVSPHEEKDFVRFAHYALAVPSAEKYKDRVSLLNDRYYSTELLFDRKQGEQKIIPIENQEGDFNKELVVVRAIVKSMKKTKHYRPSEGLDFLLPDREATAWTLLSSPTVLVHKFFDFYQDAFCVIQATPHIENWTIMLYTRDMKTKENFKTEKYNFLSGKNISGGEELNIGMANKKVVKEKKPEIKRKNKKS